MSGQKRIIPKWEGLVVPQKKGSIASLEEKAYKTFKEKLIPSSKVEEFKYLNLSSLANLNLRFLESKSSKPSSLPLKGDIYFFNNSWHLLNSKEGLEARILKKDSVPSFFFSEKALNHTFLALNTVVSSEVLELAVKKASKPLTLNVVYYFENLLEILTAPRIYLRLEKGAKLDFAQYFLFSSCANCFVNSVEEISLEQEAVLNYLQYFHPIEGSNFLFSHILSKGNSASTLNYYSVNLGGSIVRPEINVELKEEKANANINCVVVTGGREVVDTNVLMEHQAENCKSKQLVKNILFDESKAIFSGTIVVQREAQRTDAVQNSDSLLLSDSAESVSRPQLKIWADDVRCTHGSTSGQFNEEALFYLRSRGVPLKEAKKMLIESFIAQALPKELPQFIEENLNLKLSRI
ncbi:MAG: SufD family Fe-S cluster assembly protein [Candidatus Dadabacteria bacterium]|nr:MAG: SufD family Fe-S cluster assembly protein [Candidatus Dadabacteria bacterium]